MKIFSKKQGSFTPKGRVYIPINVDPDFDMYVKLQSIVKATTKANLIKVVLRKWQTDSESINELEIKIARRAFNNWKVYAFQRLNDESGDTYTKVLEEFKSMIVTELTTDSIEREHVENILKEFDNLINRDAKNEI